ncbi:MAG: TonB family protein [Deltaproteobacteria bacterium]|nr:TonB family protein [Deltaproteobacteria bacterium]
MTFSSSPGSRFRSRRCSRPRPSSRRRCRFRCPESGRLDFADDIALTSAPESAVTAQARGQAAITNGQVRAGISNEYLSETHVALGDKNAARIYTATTANDSFNGAISPKDLIAVIRSHLGAVRGAYERQLKYDPNLSGRFRVEITVASDGRVGNVRVLEDTIGSKELAASLLRNIENWRFPSPSGGTPFTFSYPFNFVQSL